MDSSLKQELDHWKDCPGSEAGCILVPLESPMWEGCSQGQPRKQIFFRGWSREFGSQHLWIF